MSHDVSPRIVSGLPVELMCELRCRALRHAIWIGLLHAQELGFADIQGQLTSILIDVDERREAMEDDAVDAVEADCQ